MHFCHFFTENYIFVNIQVNRACFIRLGVDMLKILYAEDNAGMRKMVCHFLTNVGFEVIATTDGDEAVSYTHLDVYKRQGFFFIGFKCKSFGLICKRIFKNAGR